MTTSVDFTAASDQLTSLWLDACRLQFIAQDQDTRERWADAAHAWAAVARETPWNARADLVVYWNLAASAAANATGRTT